MSSDLRQKLDSLRIDRDDEPGSPRGGRGAWIGLAAILVLAAGVALWLLRPGAVAVRTATVVAAAGGISGTAAVLNASGYVTARRQATVSSKVTGKVIEVLVEEGLRVEKDQVLARLDSSQARLGLGLAQAQLAAAEKSVVESEALRREAELRRARSRELVAQGIASPSERDAVEAEVDALAARIEAQRELARAAEREVALARQALDDTVIRAPFAGVAISKDAQPGEMISPISAGGGFTRTGISTVVDMSSLEIEVDVNEAYIQRVQEGQRVTARLDAYPEWEIPARVITTIPAADRQKATVTVRIGFDELDPRILPDMGIKVAFLAAPGESGAARPAARVARGAIRGTTGAEFVWVVGADARLERRAVKLGPGGADPAEVVAGLAVGESVVVEGPADLSAGARVVERSP
ncbi:MAG TPA: efflux RND transporter periplasmic adaptor subunit [Thermoanaerobaculia bacterium]